MALPLEFMETPMIFSDLLLSFHFLHSQTHGFYLKLLMLDLNNFFDRQILRESFDKKYRKTGKEQS